MILIYINQINNKKIRPLTFEVTTVFSLKSHQSASTNQISQNKLKTHLHVTLIV